MIILLILAEVNSFETVWCEWKSCLLRRVFHLVLNPATTYIVIASEAKQSRGLVGEIASLRSQWQEERALTEKAVCWDDRVITMFSIGVIRLAWVYRNGDNTITGETTFIVAAHLVDRSESWDRRTRLSAISFQLSAIRWLLTTDGWSLTAISVKIRSIRLIRVLFHFTNNFHIHRTLRLTPAISRW